MSAAPAPPPDEQVPPLPGPDGELREAPLAAGRYSLKRVIARGGMGVVYLAEHVHLRRPVALKILTPPPGADDDSSFQRRFQLEAETLAALDHPNIVTLYDYGQLEDGRYFLAMEYIDGPRFTDLLKDGPMQPERASRLLLQVCAALRYAHRRNLVHRDLKPSNLLIRRDDDGNEQMKVVDFGLVKVAEGDQFLTKAGHVLGSPHCMAPEQVHGGEVDHRADLYAVGVLLYRALSGAYPFHGSTAAATMIAHIKEPVPPLHTVLPDLHLPDGLEALIRRCLEKAPADRYGSVDELIRDLAACSNIPSDPYQSVSISQSTFERGAPPMLEEEGQVLPRSATSRSRLTLGAAALLACAGLAALWWWTSREAPEPKQASAAETPPPAAAADPPMPSPPPAATPDPPAQEAAPAEGTPPVEARPAPKTTRPRSTKAAKAPAEKAKEAPEGYLGLPEDL